MDMDAEVSWHVELTVNDGQLEALRALSAEMVEAARAEPGTLAYERFVTVDGKRVFLYERYVDSTAAVAHLRTFVQRFGARWGALIRRDRFTVCGPASPELREILDEFSPTYVVHLDGFHRGRQ